MSEGGSFRTLIRPAEIAGIGLHTGHPATVRLLPRERPGWVFCRADVPDRREIVADYRSLQQTSWTTTLGGTHGLLHCCEHLLASLLGLRVAGCTVEIDSDEVPIVDGSAGPFVAAMESAGLTELVGSVPCWRVVRPCHVHHGDKHVFAFPSDEFRVSCAVDYGHPMAGPQFISYVIDPDSFRTEIAPARTFALVEWIEDLRKAGLVRGGSLDCAVVVYPDHFSSPLRFPDEFPRHKALDLIGDLALLGRPVAGHFLAIKGSHRLHAELVRELREGEYLEEV